MLVGAASGAGASVALGIAEHDVKFGSCVSSFRIFYHFLYLNFIESAQCFVFIPLCVGFVFCSECVFEF